MKKKSQFQSELVNEFLTINDGILGNSPIQKSEKELVNIFNKMDDESKSYLINYFALLRNTLLMEAAEYSKENLAITLVSLGFDINHYNVNGRTTLMHAVKNKLYNLIDVLLEKGVDVNYARLKNDTIGEKVGPSALMFAAEDGEYETVKKLVEHGADTTYINDNGQYALLYTIKKTEEHFNCFKYLIEQPNNLANKLDKLGNGVFERIIKFGTIEFLKLALDNGAYNEKVFTTLRDQVERGVGFGMNKGNDKNTQQEALDMLEFTVKYMEAKKLNEELGVKPHSSPKKIKI